MKSMMQWVSAAVALSAAIGCQGAGPQGPGDIDVNEQALKSVYRYKWNGAAATASAYDAYDSLSIDVSENKANRSRSVNLQLWGYGVDPDSYTCQTEPLCWYDENNNEICEDYEYCYYADYHFTYGYGAIANDSFRVNGGLKSAQLNVDLANSPQFSAYRCDWSFGTCEALSQGTIDITWTANGAYASSSNGTSTYSYGTYSSKTTGQSSSVSADAQGSALGLDVVGYGTLSKSKGNSVDRDISSGGTGGTGGTSGTGGFGGFAGVGGSGGM